MVSDKEDWSEYLETWLRSLANKQIPTSGICFGHQILAHAFGGIVDYHPNGLELGMVDIDLTEAGKNDFEAHHAFCVHGNMWGVQFHPEFDADYMKALIELQRKNLLHEGVPVDTILESIKENDFGQVLFSRFKALIV